MGIACSIVAKLAMIPGQENYWAENNDYVATSLLDMVTLMKVIEMEKWMTWS